MIKDKDILETGSEGNKKSISPPDPQKRVHDRMAEEGWKLEKDVPPWNAQSRREQPQSNQSVLLATNQTKMKL